MNLAIIRQECGFRKGGAERYAANLCRSLAGMGHKVRVLAERCDPDLHPGITHVPIKVNRMMSSTRHNSFHRNSQKALAGLDVDAVLALSRSYPSDAFRVSDPLHDFWMKVRYPNPVNRFLQTLNPRHRTILNLEKGIFDPANTRLIITNSEFSKRLIAQSVSFPPERIHVIYNGVDHEQFSPDLSRGVAGETRTVNLLFVGQDFKRKGLAPLIRAMAKMKKAGVRCGLRVIGRDRPAPYQRLAREVGVEEGIQFDGPTRAIESAYRTADLLVFPTLYDPFANVCLEALACGLPVLTTTTNGASEILTEDVDGYVVEGQVAGLEDRLSERIGRFCMLSANTRLEMRSAAAAKSKRFTIDGNAAAVVDALSGGKAAS